MKREDFPKRFAHFLLFGLIFLACQTTLPPSISASQSLSPTPTYTPQPTASQTFTPLPPRPSITIENVDQIIPITTITSDEFTPGGVAWSPDGTKLAISGYHNTIIVETNSWSEILRLPLSSGKISWSPDGSKLATVSNGLQVWNVVENKHVFSYRDQESPSWIPLFVSWSPDGSLIAVGGGEDWTVSIIEAQTGELVQELQDLFGPAWGGSWSPDGRRFATGGLADQIIIYDASNWNQEMNLRAEYNFLKSLSWSPSGAYLVSDNAGSGFGEIKIWDTLTGIEYLDLGEVSEGDDIWDVIWSPEGNMIAAGGGTTATGLFTLPEIKIWDWTKGDLIKILLGLNEPEYEEGGSYGVFIDVDWSFDGARLAAMSSNSVVYVWGLPEEK